MTKLKLKKHLSVLPKEDVMNLVLSLYDASAEAKMYQPFSGRSSVSMFWRFHEAVSMVAWLRPRS